MEFFANVEKAKIRFRELYPDFDFNKTISQKIQFIHLDELEKLEDIFPNLDERICLDFETNTLKIFNDELVVAGFGLCDPKLERLVYVVLTDIARSSDFPDDRKQILKKFFDARKFYVFNMIYELGVLNSYFDVFPTDVIDVRQQGTALNIRGNLKSMSTSIFDIPVWTEDIENFKMILRELHKDVRPTPKGRLGYENLKWQETETKTFEEVIFKSDFYREAYESLDLPAKERDTKIIALGAKKVRIFQNFLELARLLDRNPDISKEEQSEIEASVLSFFFESPSRAKIIENTEVPYKICGLYCVFDIISTMVLGETFSSMVEEMGLSDALEVYHRHMKLGNVLQRSGNHWDETNAKKLEDRCYRERLDSLKRLILIDDPYTQYTLGIKSQKDKIAIAAETDLHTVLRRWLNPASTIKHKDPVTKIPIELDPKLITQFQQHPEIVQKLKFILSLGTSSGSDMSKLLNYHCWTPRVRIANVLFSHQTEVSILRNQNKTYQLNKVLKNRPNIEKISNHVEALRVAGKYDDIKAVINVLIEKDVYLSFEKDELNFYFEKAKNQESVSEPVFLHIWNLLKTMFGEQPDKDPADWMPEHYYLYHTRRTKKITKMMTTYIEGENGRWQIGVLPKKNITDRCPIRTPNRHPSGDPDESCIVNTDWNVTGARTKRWKSGTHTIPWGTEVSSIYTSRFKNGFVFRCDYKQMEVAMLARFSQDEKLLNAFENKEDVHMLVAEGVYQKDKSQISEVERRFSKSCTFGIIYGLQPVSFAADYLKGDIAQAQQIYDRFYNGFPSVKNWVSSVHKQALETGTGKTIWGDEINLTEAGEGQATLLRVLSGVSQEHKDLIVQKGIPALDEISLSPNKDRHWEIRRVIRESLKRAQNYPIQSSASTAAGSTIFNVHEQLRSRGMDTVLRSFIHDEMGLDVAADELCVVVGNMSEWAENFMRDNYNIPISIDMEFGVSDYTRLMIDKLHDASDRHLEFEFNSGQDSLADTVKLLEKTYKVSVENVEIVSENGVDAKEFWVPRRAFSFAIGHKFKIVRGRMKLEL